jgi:hypothetical protein
MNFNFFWILSIYTIWDGLSLKTISRYCPFKAEFRSMEQSVAGMKLHREKYSGDFIPYNMPELFQSCEKLEKFTMTRCANRYNRNSFLL